jgi:hypothetical protein
MNTPTISWENRLLKYTQAFYGIIFSLRVQERGAIEFRTERTQFGRKIS